MTRLFIRSAEDLPHDRAFSRIAYARCGVDLEHAKEITEEQARVWLGDARCPACFPHWHSHNLPMHGRPMHGRPMHGRPMHGRKAAA